MGSVSNRINFQANVFFRILDEIIDRVEKEDAFCLEERAKITESIENIQRVAFPYSKEYSEALEQSRGESIVPYCWRFRKFRISNKTEAELIFLSHSLRTKTETHREDLDSFIVNEAIRFVLYNKDFIKQLVERFKIYEYKKIREDDRRPKTLV